VAKGNKHHRWVDPWWGNISYLGAAITTKIIHQQSVMLKSIKQRVFTNLNHIDTVIEMDISDTANFGDSGMFTLHEAFLSYTNPFSDPIFAGIEATQTGGTYRLLFHEKNSDVVDTILTDIGAKLEVVGNWDEIPVHYRYITLDEVEVEGHNEQGQGKQFWQDHYKVMCGSIPDVVHTDTFDRPPQRWSPNVQLS
jgi:hypothetical protein